MGDFGDRGDADKSSDTFHNDVLTERIIGAALRVYNDLGPGFDEKIYQNALAIELASLDIEFEIEVRINVKYRGKHVGKHRLDVLVGGLVVIELKVVDELSKKHYRQLKSYLKSASLQTGLLINFDAEKLDFRRVTLKSPSP